MNIGIIDRRSIWVEGVFYILKSNFEQFNIYRFQEYDELAHMMTSSEIDVLICSEEYLKKYKKRIYSSKRVEYIIVFTRNTENVHLETEGIYYLEEEVEREELISIVKGLLPQNDIKDNSKVTLTSREYNLLYLLSLGYSNKEIGKKLYIAEKTVKNNLTDMYKKLGLKNRYDAIKYYETRNEM